MSAVLMEMERKHTTEYRNNVKTKYDRTVVHTTTVTMAPGTYQQVV